MTDFAAAQAKAKAEKKDLLVDFTGSDWCGWCIKLDDEVFSQEAFVTSAPQSFVLVKLDYPKDKSKMSEATIKQNEMLQGKYPVEGFPTILLMNPAGHVFGKAGYLPDGPEPYNAMLAEKVKAAKGFKAALAMAAGKQGPERAKALDDGLSALDQEIANTYHYELMKEIVALDPDGKAGLKAKYAETVAKMEEMAEQMEANRMLAPIGKELNELIAEHMKAGEGEKALAKLEAMIQKPKSKMHQQMAMFFKGMVIMDTTGDKQAAIAALEAAAKLAPKSPIAQQVEMVLPRIKAAPDAPPKPPAPAPAPPKAEGEGGGQ